MLHDLTADQRRVVLALVEAQRAANEAIAKLEPPNGSGHERAVAVSERPATAESEVRDAAAAPTP
jgi:hypothetical protein